MTTKDHQDRITKLIKFIVTNTLRSCRLLTLEKNTYKKLKMMADLAIDSDLIN